MNSEKPQNPNSEFSQDFDNEEAEIDVAYEEITPEEQLAIKQRNEKAASEDSSTESLSDMWLDDDTLDIIDVPSETETTAKTEVETSASNNTDRDIAPETAKSIELGDLNEESEKLEPLAPKATESAIANDLDISETSDNLENENSVVKNTVTDIPEETNKTANEAPDYVEDIESETEEESAEKRLSDRETEQLLDDVKNAESLTPALDFTEPEVESKEPEKIEEPVATESDSEPELIADSWLEESEQISQQSQSEREKEKEPEKREEPDATESNSEPELIADSWLEESEQILQQSQSRQERELSDRIAELERQKATLLAEIATLQEQKAAEIAEKTRAVSTRLEQMILEGTTELQERKNSLLIDIEKLERRKERIDREMRTTFAGTSQDLAVRIQGFKQYLVGSLQELAIAAEKLDLPQPEERSRPPQREGRPPRESRTSREGRPLRENRTSRSRPPEASSSPQFTEQAFADQTRRIRQLIEQYRTKPDYYGPPWQLRRTFEPVHAEKVQEWFFGQGGRGAVKGMGSRLQNILVASAVISILYRLYRDRCRILVLVDTPEKLGEWRRGLQDCLGISRNDFGSNRGVVLFESADVLVQRAERLLEDKLLPLIIIDETEALVNLSLLKFPLWLAFAEKPQSRSSGYLY